MSSVKPSVKMKKLFSPLLLEHIDVIQAAAWVLSPH